MRLAGVGEQYPGAVRGRPRRHDGAPLRPALLDVRQVAGRVVPVVTTGLHCGCSMARRMRWTGSRVVPVATTGLHCGPKYSRPRQRGDGARRPRRHDGAPLRRQRGRHAQEGLASSPSSRRGSIAAAPSNYSSQTHASVVPVVTTGLHCGPVWPDATSIARASRPRRHDGGSIAARSEMAITYVGASRPRRHDGAPLRHQYCRRG